MVAPGTVEISDFMFKLLLYFAGTFFLLWLVVFVYVFPWLSLCWNRWKLKFKGKRGFTPVYMRMKNRKIKEIVVDTRQATFSYDEKMYNVREEAILELFGFKCLFYDHDNPEPLKMITDEEKEVIVQMVDGSIKKMKGKLVDAKQYDNTCNLFYWAGFLKGSKLKNYLTILVIVAIAAVVIFGIANYLKATSTNGVCSQAVGMLTNATVYIKYNVTQTATSGMTPVA